MRLLLRIQWLILLMWAYAGLGVRAQAPASCAPTAGLQCWLPLDETSGTRAGDTSGHGLDGQLTGGTWLPTGGHDGQGALQLLDGELVTIPLNWQPNGRPTAYSLAFWLKPLTLYNWSQGTGDGWGTFLFHSTATGGIYVGTDVPTRIDLGYANLVERNVWQHFVFTFDNGVGSLYKNGQLLTRQGGMTLPNTWQGLRLGASGEEVYDDVRLYDRALTGQEARNLYQCNVSTAVQSACTPTITVTPTAVTVSATAATALRATTNVAGSALSFNGAGDRLLLTDAVTAAAHLATLTNTFTVEAWVWPSAPHEVDAVGARYGGTSGQRYLLHPQPGDQYDTNAGGAHVGMGLSVGTNGVSVYEYTYNYLPAVLVYECPTSSPLSGWTHVAVVYRNGTPTLYLHDQQGQLLATVTGQPSAAAFVHPSFDVGGGNYGYYQGRLDELRYWTTDRPEAYTYPAFTRTLPRATAGLTGYWRFDEGQGDYAADVSAAQQPTLLRVGASWTAASAVPAPVAAASIRWSPAVALSAATGADVTARPAQTTTYTAVAAGPDGCGTASATAILTVQSTNLPPDNPDPNTERNWTFERSYDGNGNVVAESKQFTDGLGRATQAQARNAATQQVFAAQTIYNTGGQPVLQTLAAPTNNQSFAYQQNFVTATVGGQSTAYGPAQFEDANASSPTPVEAASIGTLGYYYSKLNAQEPLTPLTSYPYSLVEMYQGPMGGTKRAAAPGDELRMGLGREARGRDFLVRKEFDAYLALRPQFVPGSLPVTLEYQALKSVSVNADGRERIAVMSKNGETLVTCLSGPQYPAQPVFGFISAEGPLNTFDANAPVYADVHIPVAGPQDVKFTMGKDSPADANQVAGTVRIVNLLTDEVHDYDLKATNVGVTEPELHVALDPGFYRFVSLRGTQWTYYEAHYGNFSYTYYDDAGRAIATVAPNGLGGNPSGTTPLTFVTRNTYDTKGQLLATESDDEGRSEYVYALDGRIRFSQSALQRTGNRFSYSNYDEVGRVVESGEYTPGSTVFENHLTATPAANSVLQPSLLEDRTRAGGLAPASCAQRNQVWYDLPFDGTVKKPDGTPDPAYQDNQLTQLIGRHQEFVVGAVAKTQNDKVTSWYSYDELGRVTWMVQDIAGVGVKTLDYQYDFSGNVLQVAYQQGQPDSFYHYYGYDAAQRLTSVYTSPDGVAQTLQAQYTYYLHGPLKRVQVAGDLQGIDYVYTLQGALKSINHTTTALEPGQDAPTTNGVYKDLFALTLEYFSGDYRSASIDVPAPPLPPGSGAPVAARYDGTIRSASWRTGASADIQRMAYTYDEKSQLQNSTYSNWQLISKAYQLNAGSTNSFQEGGLSYDPNGNILSLKRTGATGLVTDDFSYKYKANTNQLTEVHAGSAAGPTVLDYDYDELGQLTRQRDEQGQRYFTYDVTGKTTGVYLDQAHQQPVVTFAYDDRGFRVSKTSYPTGGGPAATTTYVRDVAGNILAIYAQAAQGGPWQRTEVPLYGASRLGTLTHLADNSDDYRYELSDHLGDARVVFHRPTTQVDVETMELGGVPSRAAFLNDDLYRVAADNAPSPDYVARMTDSQPAGQELKRVLAVTRGDTITFSALALWEQNASSGGSGTSPFVLVGAGAGVNALSQRGADGQTGTYATNNPNWLALLSAGLGFTIGQSAPASLGNTSLEGWIKYRVLDAQGNPMLDAQNHPIEGIDYLLGTGKWEYLQTGVRVPQDGTIEVMAGTSGTGEAVYFDNLRVEQTGGLIVQEQHQYAFGAPLPGLSYTVGNRRYRYGYQGQYAEHDDETGFESFELRLYNSRVGRWLGTDPEGQYDSPYIGMGNNTVSGVDPDGGFSLSDVASILRDGGPKYRAASRATQSGLSAWARIGLQATSSFARLTQRSADFAMGAAGAYGNDMMLQAPGLIHHVMTGGYPGGPRNADVAAGEFLGHGLALIHGLEISVAGLGGEAGGGALSLTGIGTIPGVIVVSGSTAAVVYGGGVTVGSIAGLISSGQAMLNMAKYKPEEVAGDLWEGEGNGGRSTKFKGGKKGTRDGTKGMTKEQLEKMHDKPKGAPDRTNKQLKRIQNGGEVDE